MPLTPEQRAAIVAKHSTGTPKPATPGKPESPSPPASGGGLTEPPEGLTEYQGLSSTMLQMGEAGKRVQASFGKGLDDFLVPTVAVPKGDHAGKMGIDIAGMRKAMTRARLKSRTDAYKAEEGTAPDAAWIKAWRVYETNEAHNDLMEWNREQRGAAPDTGVASMLSSLWVDTDWGGGHEELAAQEAGTWFAPLKASIMGVKQTVYDGAKAESYNEGGFWGGVDYWGRFQASTYLAAAAKAGGVEGQGGYFARAQAIPGDVAKTWGAWGSREHLEEIQKGEDIVSLADDLGLGELNPGLLGLGTVLVNQGVIEEGTRQGAADFSAGLSIAILDPFDLFFLGKMGQIATLKGGAKLAELGDAVGLTISAAARATEKATSLRRASDTIQGIVEREDVFEPKKAMEALAEMQKSLPSRAVSRAVTLNTMARLGSSAPVSVQTTRAFKAAQEARQFLTEAYGELATDLAASAADVAATAKPAKGKTPKKPKKPKPSPAEAVDRLHLARLEHMAWTMVRRDLLAHQKTLRVLAQDLPGDDISKTFKAADWEEAQLKLLEAQAALGRGIEGADEAFEQASAIYQAQAYQAALALGSGASKMMDKHVLEGDRLLKAADLELEKAILAASVHAPAVFKAELVEKIKKHKKLIKHIHKRAPADADRSALSLFARSARDLAEGYRRIAEMPDDASELAGFARDADRVLGEWAHADGSGTFRGMLKGETLKFTEAAAHVINPAAKHYGSESEAVQQVGGALESWVGMVKQDLLILGEVADEVEAIANMNKYITSRDMLGGGVHKTLLNGIGEGTFWDEAKPILRHLARGGTGKSHALEAVIDMWYPSGVTEETVKSAAPRIAKAARNLLTTGSRTGDGGTVKAAEMTWDTFSNELRHATAEALTHATKAPVAAEHLLKDGMRSTAFGVQGVIQAALTNRAAKRTMQLLGDLTPQTMRAVENISLGRGHLAGDQYMKAMQVFDVLNIPSVQRKLIKSTGQELEAGLAHLGGASLEAAGKAMEAAKGVLAKARGTKKKKEAKKALKEAKKAYYQAVQDSVIVPRIFMERLASRFEGIIKSTEEISARTSDPLQSLASQKVATLARLWNTSLLTGLILPRPTYFTNIFVGNFAQMWGDVDLRTAARVTRQTVGYLPLEAASHLPVFGKYVDQARVRMAQSLGVGVDGVLPSIFQSVFNPHLARFYDPNLAKPGDKVGSKFHPDLTYGDLRRHAAEQGVLTSFVGAGSDLQNMVKRTKHYSKAMTFWENAGEKAGYLKHAYADIADSLEQRQRVALFTDLIARKGLSPEQAGLKVREALYDWSAPLTEFETQYITKVFMFWNFSRKALGQGFRNLTSAFVNSEADSLLDAAIKTSSPMSALAGKDAYSTTRLTDMYHATEAGKEFMRTWDTPPEGDESDPELRAVYPWWMKDTGSMMALTNTPLNQTQLDYNQTLGRKVTHRALAMPSFTPLEYSSFWVDMTRMALAVPFSRDQDALSALTEMGLHTIKTQGGNITGPAMEAALKEAMGDGDPRYASETLRVKKLSDRVLLGGMSAAYEGAFGEAFIYPDDERGEEGMMRVSKRAFAMYKMALPISHEMSTWLDPILENAATRKYAEENGIDPAELKRGIMWMTRQYMGLGKEFYHAPEETLKYDEKDLKRRAGLQKHEAKRKYAGEVDWLGRRKD